MLWKKPAPDFASLPPVQQTPPGAEPRELRSDTFLTRPDTAAPKLAARESPAPLPAASVATVERDWDFALPEPPPQKDGDPLLDPDTNWRQHAGLRAPLEPAALKEDIRERFSDNWARLAAEPPRHSNGHRKHTLQRSPLTRWMFSHGHFDITAAAGPLLLLALLIAGVILGSRLLLGGGVKSAPAGESRR